MKHNIKIVACLVILLFRVSGLAQEKPFKQAVQELDSLLSLHDELHPSYGIIALKDAGVTYQALLEEFTETDEFELSPDKDSIDVFSLKYYYEQKIRHKFREVMYHHDAKKHDLSKMIDDLLISDDKKFYSLSIDENTGGSYHSRITMYHYIGVPETDKTAFEDFASDGYYEVFTLKTKQGTKYLLIGTVITCNTCMATYALLTHFENGKFVNDFETIIDGRMGSEITFDPGTQILSVGYSTDDLVRECFCESGNSKAADNNKYYTEEELIIHHCSCKYKFDGNTFKLVSHLFEIEKE